MSQLSGAKIGSRAVRCGWAHHKKDAMQSIDYTTVDQARYLQLFAAALLALQAPLACGSHCQAARPVCQRRHGSCCACRIMRRPNIRCHLYFDSAEPLTT